ncbi:transcriptional regulator [Thermosipho africanus TCF52B]|jgi:DNA-binding MarR family transcriptional regulator|uniref:Transcriptional regulator n=1 Tax=Thermosipho africanus (strain TCF52B) TaxID=484019 RepID=B7IGK1_THEAB|nr:winged helix-turn-helix transcriptional regulator [Thermosipho africanus]ACJ75215.1 transcriptional regulator [Thermosipho africanus TCF52B]
MEDNKIKLLEIIYENPGITQREIAKRTGLSLGLVNLLLKKFVRKGLIKLEKLNKKTFKYILTPKGFAEKAKKTIQYIRIYYEKIKQIKVKVEKIVKENGKDKIYAIYGEDEFIINVVREVLKNLKVKYVIYDKTDEITQTQDMIILYWDVEKSNILKDLRSFLVL